jgi:hypothetical protein
MAPLNEALDLHRDQQAHGNREQMNQELSKSVDSLMR